MNFLFNLVIGILIGFGAILPGVSSGVFCVIFGIYEKLVDSVLNLFKDFKKNFVFLLPIGLGSFLGIVLFGNVIKYFFNTFKFQACYAFIGLILGTIPALFKQANFDKCIQLKKLLPLIISFSIGVLLIVFEKHFDFNNIVLYFVYNPFYLIFAGFIMSIGIVVPGVSNTIILMCLGVYSEYLSAIASVNLRLLVPLSIGVFLGSIVWLKIINILLKKYHQSTFLAIIGFTLGSIFVLYPGFSLDLIGLVSIIIMLVSLVLSYKLAKYE
mgnify:FL=1